MAEDHKDPKFTVQQLDEYRRKKAEEPVSPLDRRLALGLDMNKDGKAIANLSNCAIIIERDKGLQRVVWYDQFLQRIMTDETSPREWGDPDNLETAIYIQTELGIPRMGKETVADAVIAHAYRHPRNCVREWLDALQWDNLERVAHFFPDYFGAEATDYTRAVSRNFWLCIAARIYRPGCQVDNMVVLEGGQGIGKSKALRLIGADYFADLGAMALDKSFFECLQGKFLLEIGEMDAFSRSEVERVKTAVSRPTDRFRESYAHFAKDHPRQCVFVGTTNRDDWNRDDTGARRFWPIACGDSIDIIGMQKEREQFFAEAVALFKSGAEWWHVPAKAAVTEQDKRFTDDVWQEAVTEFVTGKRSVTIKDILTDKLGIRQGDLNRGHQMRAASCLKRMKWRRKQQSDGSWRYINPAIEELPNDK